jgi:hypothetical protein
MANVEQLELLQERIGSEPVMPDALDRYRALKMLQQKPVRREGGGQLNTIEDIASKGRYGDTMLMHVNPREVRGLDSLGEMTYNPETGLPEAWLWALPLAGAAIGGIGAKLMDKDPLTGALIGGGIGLGGMGFAGPTATGLGGLFGVGSAGALPGLWQGLTPIGQGMVMGGAMGGVRGLFGQSENPMRDMLVGAAMGGVGGALFGGAGTATGAAEAELAASDAFTAGVSPSIEVPSAVSKIGSTVVVPSPGGAFQQAATRLNPAARATPTSYVPITTPVHGPGTYTGFQGGYKRPTPGLGEFGQAINPAKWTSEAAKQRAIANVATDREAILKGTKAVTAGTAGTDPSKADPGKTFFGGLKDWWKDREWYEKAGLAGLGAWGATELLSGREQAELEEPTPIQPFEKGEPKPLQEPIQPLTEEQILAAYSGPSGTGIDTWFQPQVAKEGGLLSVIKRPTGGPLWTGEQGPGAKLPPSGYTWVPGMGPSGGPKLMTIADAGGAYTQYGGVSADPGFTPASQLPSSGGGGASTPIELPTDPFQSNLSSFNIQDALARITGQSAVPEQITLPTPSQLPALATSSQLPAGNIQQGASALSDLFSRFQQQQGDPIVDIVSSTGAVPEVASAQQGGMISLFGGGATTGGVSGGSFGLSGGSASGMAGSGPGAGGAGIGTGIGKSLTTSVPYNVGLGKSGQPLSSPTPPTVTFGKSPATFTQTGPGPAAISTADVNRSEALNALGQALSPASSVLGLSSGPATALSLATSFGPTAILGMPLSIFADFASKATPQSVADASAWYGSEAGQAQVGAESAGVTQRGDPSGGEDPFHVPNPILGEGPMATGASAFINQGGSVGLARGGVFEGRVQGQGDGMADKVAFNVVPQTPADIPNTPDMALLSSDEYVVPADVVSMLGNGSSTAGAQSLDKFNQLMRKKAHGTNKQQRELNAGKELSSLV